MRKSWVKMQNRHLYQSPEEQQNAAFPGFAHTLRNMYCIPCGKKLQLCGRISFACTFWRIKGLWDSGNMVASKPD